MRRWLLVGNSRWHWAEHDGTELRIRHGDPDEGLRSLAAGPPPLAWAAVGSLPVSAPLDPTSRIACAAVPLQDLPGWIGVDRALAGWLAWRRSGGAVLVADAGTVLSLTRVDRRGRFAGGRLLAGLALQLRAMAQGTAALPDPPPPGRIAGRLGPEPWPAATEAAMLTGVTRGLAAALAMALREARQDDPETRLVLSGGDAALLLPPCLAALEPPEAAAVEHQPDLALRALLELGGLAAMDQSSPRSLSS